MEPSLCPVLALGWSSAAGMHPAYDGQDGVTPGRDVEAASRTSADAPPGTEAQQPVKITDLLARVERQIADGHMWSPPNDNAIDTFKSLADFLTG